mmetsp:Transcript_41369/g.115226  ORF Transcript_41369/g.115226 Transcript_41369/m.115226 type:complete len:287 (+) Transcript_41369:227-1087(+)
MFPVCDRAMPSKDVIAAPRSRVKARKTARFSSATSARSNWSTMASLSRIELCVSSWAVSSRPNGSKSPYGISEESISGAAAAAGAAGFGAAAAGIGTCSASSASSSASASFAARNACSGPFANLDSGSEAWVRTAWMTLARASKTTSSMLSAPWCAGSAPTTLTSSGAAPVASETAAEKRSAKSAGKGPFTSIWPLLMRAFWAAFSFEERIASRCCIFSMIWRSVACEVCTAAFTTGAAGAAFVTTGGSAVACAAGAACAGGAGGEAGGAVAASSFRSWWWWPWWW